MQRIPDDYDDKSDAWKKGYAARLNDERDDASPFDEGTKEDEEWSDGWIQAEFDEDANI